MLRATLISLSYPPRLQKTIPNTSDPPLKMVVASAGLTFGSSNGVLRDDLVPANSIGATLALARRAWVQNLDLSS
jgi:hypothetical protein